MRRRRRPYLIIEPRTGIQPRTVKNFLEAKFQQPGQADGNPLINANIEVKRTEPREWKGQRGSISWRIEAWRKTKPWRWHYTIRIGKEQ